MIDVEEATQITLSYFEDLYGEDAFSNVLLEEVERDEEDGPPFWFITIGFTEKSARENHLGISFRLGAISDLKSMPKRKRSSP